MVHCGFYRFGDNLIKVKQIHKNISLSFICDTWNRHDVYGANRAPYLFLKNAIPGNLGESLCKTHHRKQFDNQR